MHSTIMTSDYIVFKFNVTITICSSILGAINYGSFSVLTYILKIPYIQTQQTAKCLKESASSRIFR